MGPAVSCDEEIGTIPDLLTNPTVGLNPTIPLIDAGQEIEPFVSVPMLTFTIPDATATADPELEPQGLNSLPNG